MADVLENTEEQQNDFNTFIDSNRPFMKRARNRSFGWSAVAVAGVALSLGTLLPTVAVLGSVAAATGALTVGLPLLMVGGAGAGLGISNVVKYVRYSRLFRHLTRACTGQDEKGVNLSSELLSKSVKLVKKLAAKLGISQLPAHDALQGVEVEEIGTVRQRLSHAASVAADKMEKGAVVIVESGIKAGKAVAKGARKAGSAVKSVFTRNNAEAQNDSATEQAQRTRRSLLRRRNRVDSDTNTNENTEESGLNNNR